MERWEALPNFVNTAREGALWTFSEVVNFFLKRYGTDNNAAKIDNEVQSLKQ